MQINPICGARRDRVMNENRSAFDASKVIENALFRSLLYLRTNSRLTTQSTQGASTLNPWHSLMASNPVHWDGTRIRTTRFHNLPHIEERSLNFTIFPNKPTATFSPSLRGLGILRELKANIANRKEKIECKKATNQQYLR